MVITTAHPAIHPLGSFIFPWETLFFRHIHGSCNSCQLLQGATTYNSAKKVGKGYATLKIIPIPPTTSNITWLRGFDPIFFCVGFVPIFDNFWLSGTKGTNRASRNQFRRRNTTTMLARRHYNIRASGVKYIGCLWGRRGLLRWWYFRRRSTCTFRNIQTIDWNVNTGICLTNFISF